MRRLLAIGMLAGIITLAIIIGQRMSTDAMAVMIGVVFGVAASIPTSLIIALAVRGSRRAETTYHREDYPPAPTAPQIIVVSPGQLAPGLTPPNHQPVAQLPSHHYPADLPRRYKVVGESEYELADDDQPAWR